MFSQFDLESIVVSRPNLKIMPKKSFDGIFCYKQTTPMDVLHMNLSFELREIPSELLTLESTIFKVTNVHKPYFK